ncbi:MAG: polysaccharide biosynthesis tyrosine autokinase [Thermomicrobiales bacterium]|nr:polysaccharide biosynthesis tyrosine autokinase [Thermomicrobiales bacterium]
MTGAMAYYNVSREIPLYQTTGTMVVNPGAISGTGITSSSLYGTSLYDTMSLMNTYVQLINSEPVRMRVEAMFPEGEYPGGVMATSSEGSLLIYITSISADPQQAADTANAYIKAFPEYIAEQNAERIDLSRAAVDSQIAYLQTQIADVDARIMSATDEERTSLWLQRQALVEQISNLQSDAARSEMQASSMSTFVKPLDTAYVPTTPFSPNVQRTTQLGIFVGILLAVGVIALLEFLDNTVKGHTNIHDLAKSPLLASIPSNAGIQQGPRQIFTLADTKSGAAEAVRLLRTNLTFAGVEHPIRSLTVTSSIEGEGKSTIAANLAVSIASSGKSVALIDADLRKPTQHRIFGIENAQGVTTYLSDQGERWQEDASRVALPGLTVISSGPIPPNPAEMLVASRFAELIAQLEAEFDVVIIDTPPVLQASDALIVGSLTDGILLVTQHGRTRIDALRNSSGLVHQSGTRLVGVVVNRVDKSGGNYYGGGYYGEYYGHTH